MYTQSKVHEIDIYLQSRDNQDLRTVADFMAALKVRAAQRPGSRMINVLGDVGIANLMTTACANSCMNHCIDDTTRASMHSLLSRVQATYP